MVQSTTTLDGTFPSALNLHFVSWDCPAKFHETHFGNPMESPMIFRKDSSRETAPKNDEVTTCYSCLGEWLSQQVFLGGNESYIYTISTYIYTHLNVT
jgi:hypothetical protein